MRALLLKKLGEPEDLALLEIADPEPGPGELIVDIY